MSFDVFLIPSDLSPTGDEARQAVDRALALCGARRGGAGECDIVDAEGLEHEFFGPDGEDASGMFPLRGLDPTIAQIIFEVAEATRCFIVPAQENTGLLRTPGNTSNSPETAMSVIDVGDPEALLQFLSGGFEPWADYRDEITS